MTNAARAGRVDEQDCHFGSARAGCKRFLAVNDVSTVDLFNRGPEACCLSRLARLRLAAPGHPFLASFHDP